MDFCILFFALFFDSLCRGGGFKFSSKNIKTQIFCKISRAVQHFMKMDFKKTKNVFFWQKRTVVPFRPYSRFHLKKNMDSKKCFGSIPMIKIVPLLKIKFCQITFVPTYMSSLFAQIDQSKFFCSQKFLKIIFTFRIDFRFWFEKCQLIISNLKNYWNFGGLFLELIRTSKQSNVLFRS